MTETATTPALGEQSSAANGSTTVWNDAAIVGDLATPESQAVLSSQIEFLTGPNMYTFGKKWERSHGTVNDLIDIILSCHPVVADKDGPAAIYAMGPNTTKKTSSNVVTQYASKLKDTLQRVTAFVGDVDGTDTVERFQARVVELGLYCVIYTTHSHAAKKTATGDRFRFIIFLAQPFIIPDDKDGRKAAIADWESRYAGMCELLGVDDLDAASLRPNQMMYTPRRPSADSEYKSRIIAGRALTINEMPLGDASKYKKSAPSGASGVVSSDVEVTGHILSDGFDVHEWHRGNVGGQIQIESVFEALGWPILGSAGDGFTIQCPNEASHTEPGGTGTWACEAQDDESDFVIMCHHAHCAGHYTWNFIAQLEQNILDGVVGLPDEYDTLSEMLCDPSFYADEVLGEPVDIHPTDFGVVQKLEIPFLSNAIQVKRSYEAVVKNDRAGADDYAALYAGVKKAGSKKKAVEKLDALMIDGGEHNGNERTALAKRGTELLKADKAAYAAQQKDEAVASMDDKSIANLSMDIAEPLGDTLSEALATLSNRYAIVDVSGKLRFLRKPDLSLLGSASMQSIIIASTKQDFIDFHANRSVEVDGEKVNPAKLFLERQKRYSGITFAPYPASAGSNEFNMYYGRSLESVEGGFDDLKSFLLDVVCNGDADKYDWLELYLAHMVQRPGDKPGTSLVATGPGGIGKGTFGEILKKLTHPHYKLLEQESHLVGQFAGEHLSKCICVHVSEAMLTTPKTANAVKSLATSPTIQVEPKGMSLYEADSYMRMYIEGNGGAVVVIAGDGSERRFFVFRPSDERQGDREYFKELYAHIHGDQMAALLHHLETYDPAAHGFEWADVRTAPDTPERTAMRFHTMTPAYRRFIQMFEAGSLRWGDDVETVFADDEWVRVPVTAVKDFLRRDANKFQADDTDPVALAQKMFGASIEVDGVHYQTVSTGQGPIQSGDGLSLRYVEYPPANVVLQWVDENFYQNQDVGRETYWDIEAA